MKKMVLIIAAMVGCGAMAQTVMDSAWRDDVKTASLYRAGAELEWPLLTLDGKQRLVLEMDVLRPNAERLRWHLAHCDAEWRRDGLMPQEFIVGFEAGEIEDYDLSFATQKDYVHYRATIPGEYAEIIHSGNYVVYVTSEDDSDTLLSRRFAVSEERAHVSAEVVRPYDGVEVERRQEVDVSVESRDVQLVPQWMRVMARQNGRWDNSRELEFAGYSGSALSYRNRQGNVFEGGNTYRFFDMSNLHSPMYNVIGIDQYGGETMVVIKPCEDRSRGHYVAETVLRGGMKVNVWDRQQPQIEADYVWVNITLPMAQPMIDGEVFVVGALTDWRLDGTSRMEYDPRRRAYTIRLLLKQGYYAYQLLFRPMRQREGQTGRIEGNHWETRNRYAAFVYYKSPADRAERLIGVGEAER